MFLVLLALGPAILCNINISGYTCVVYMYCFGYYVSYKASIFGFPNNAALRDEFLVSPTGSPRAYP